MIRAEFEGEYGFGRWADASGAAADLGQDAPGLQDGEAAFVGSARVLLTVRLLAF